MNYLDNSEVRSYGLLSAIASGAKALGSGVMKAGSTALSSLGNAGSAIYKGADTVLGGLLPGAVAPSAGWMGQGGLGLLGGGTGASQGLISRGYSGLDGMLGGMLPGGMQSTGNGMLYNPTTGAYSQGGGFMGGLGNLYGGADKLLGGMLPNIGGYGVTPSQGWLGSMYGKADNALGGYLPGGQTPAQVRMAGHSTPPGKTHPPRFSRKVNGSMNGSGSMSENPHLKDDRFLNKVPPHLR
jgi:hypothetical protein